MSKATVSEVENMMLRGSDDLCKLAEMLGYRPEPGFGQLQCKNGAFVSSLLEFFNDNPGAIEAVHNFVLENIDCYELEEDEDGTDEDVEDET